MRRRGRIRRKSSNRPSWENLDLRREYLANHPWCELANHLPETYPIGHEGGIGAAESGVPSRGRERCAGYRVTPLPNIPEGIEIPCCICGTPYLLSEVPSEAVCECCAPVVPEF